MDPAPRPALATGAAVVIVATLGASYMVSQLLRNAIGVLAPIFGTELGLSASQISVVASVFFLIFVIVQIPLGVALDRFGPKRCMVLCAAVTIVGTMMFASAANFTEMLSARALMGLGTSCYFMAPLAFYARVFPPTRFAFLTGLQLAVGSLGTLLATAPLAFATQAVGWRTSFVVIAGVMGLIGLMIAVLMPDTSARASGTPPESLHDGLRGVAAAWRQPDMRRVFVMHLPAYASFVLIVGLWGGPYLTHVYGYDLADRGALLFAAAAMQAIGSLAWGAADRLFGGYRVPAMLGAVLTAVLLIVIAAAGEMPAWALWGWFVAFGFCSAYLPVVIAHGRALFPPALVGRGITLLNIGTMGGGFLSQSVSGVLMDLYTAPGGRYPIAAYATVFAVQSVFVIAALMVYRTTREPLAAGGSNLPR